MLNDHGTTDRRRLASDTDTLRGNGHGRPLIYPTGGKSALSLYMLQYVLHRKSARAPQSTAGEPWPHRSPSISTQRTQVRVGGQAEKESSILPPVCPHFGGFNNGRREVTGVALGHSHPVDISWSGNSACTVVSLHTRTLLSDRKSVV